MNVGDVVFNDPELKLLNDLLRDHKGDVYNFIHLKTDVTGAYARDKRTFCSGTEDYYTQTKLGFLNQMRMIRRLPRIAVVLEGQTILRFELYAPDVQAAPLGMYAMYDDPTHPVVKVGEYKITSQSPGRVWIEETDGAGGEFGETEFADHVKTFFERNL